MRQVDYFKFLKKFPQYIDINDTNDVKLALLMEVKKIAKSNKNNYRLLPVSWNNVNVTIKDLIDAGFTAHQLNIKYRTKLIFSIFVIDSNIEYRFVHRLNHPFYLPENIFMDKNQITNLKRTILINNMIK